MNKGDDYQPLAPFAPVALRMLNHAVLSDEGAYWNLLLRHAKDVRDYFARIGLSLQIYEDEGYAFLTQPDQPDGDETPLPRITPRRPLTRSVTMVALIMREYIDEWAEQHRAGRCHMAYADIYERCRPFLPQTTDERSHVSTIDSALNKLVEWEWIVKHDVPGGKPYFEVRPLIKAMFGPDVLTAVQEVLSHDAAGI